MGYRSGRNRGRVNMVTQLVTFNVNGIGDNTKRWEVFHYLHSKKFDIIMLQETHSTKEVCSLWKTEWGGKVWFSHDLSNARGVMIMFKNGWVLQIHTTLVSEDGRFLILYATINS